jgi:hypothetical protein
MEFNSAWERTLPKSLGRMSGTANAKTKKTRRIIDRKSR